MTDPSKGKLLYHLTHINNVSSILENGLMSRKALGENGFIDVADPEIIKIRKEHDLLDYVLFHFFVKNPFDGKVCKKHGSQNMAIIAVYRSLHLSQDFYIIPMHPLDKEQPQIFSYEDGIAEVRWDILDDKDNRDYHDSIIKSACMAECITDSLVEPEDIAFIYVYDNDAKKKIEKQLGRTESRITVNPKMFP